MKSLLQVCFFTALFFQHCHGMDRQKLRFTSRAISKKEESLSCITNTDGSKIAVMNPSNGVIRSFDALSQKCELEVPETGIETVLALSLCGQRVFGATKDCGKRVVYDLARHKPICNLNQEYEHGEFSSDDRRIVAAGRGYHSPLHIINASSGKILTSIKVPEGGSVKSCHFDSNAENIIASTTKFVALICSVQTGEIIQKKRKYSSVGHPFPTIFSPDGSYIAFQTDEKCFAICDRNLNIVSKECCLADIRRMYPGDNSVLVVCGRGRDCFVVHRPFNSELNPVVLRTFDPFTKEKYCQVIGYNGKDNLLITYTDNSLLCYSLSNASE